MEIDEQHIERPTIITVICIIGFIGAGFSLVLLAMWDTLARKIGPWYPPFLLAAAAVGMVCFLGMWRMRKWSVLLYTGVTVLNQVVMLWQGAWNPMALLIPAVVIGIGFSQFNKMR
jgi:hypothetical protein